MEVFRDLFSEEKVKTGDGRDEKCVDILFEWIFIFFCEWKPSGLKNVIYGFENYTKVRFASFLLLSQLLDSCKCCQNDRTLLFQ